MVLLLEEFGNSGIKLYITDKTRVKYLMVKTPVKNYEFKIYSEYELIRPFLNQLSYLINVAFMHDDPSIVIDFLDSLEDDERTIDKFRFTYITRICQSGISH